MEICIAEIHLRGRETTIIGHGARRARKCAGSEVAMGMGYRRQIDRDNMAAAANSE